MVMVTHSWSPQSDGGRLSRTSENRVAVSFQIGLLPNRPISEVAELASAAEQLGFDGVWIADSQSAFRDGFASLTAAALNTETIKLATGVTNPVTRHPAVLAGSFASLDELSGGRSIIGIGTGESATSTAGLRPARLARLREVVEAVRGLTRGEEVTIDGTTLQIPWAHAEPPVFVASSGPRSLRMSATYADGILFQVGAAPGAVRYALNQIEAGLTDAGRERSEVKLYARLACSVAADRSWARKQVLGYASVAAGTVFTSLPSGVLDEEVAEDIGRMKQRYDYLQHGSQTAGHLDAITDRIIDAVTISGTPEEAVPRFRELIALGLDGFVLPVAGDEPRASMAAISENVVPNI